MSYKAIDPCIQKAFDDEMLFVLMARDPSAPIVIMEWVKLNLNSQPIEKLNEAMACAKKMIETCNEMSFRKGQLKRHEKLVAKLNKVKCSDCVGMLKQTGICYCEPIGVREL